MPDKAILVVDDSIITRQIVRRILKNLGYGNIIEATNGAEALERILAPGSDIGLILLDWNMPQVTGLQLLGQLRDNLSTARIPVVMISAESAPERVLEAVRAGAKSYVIKPFHPRELKVKINEALRLAELDEQRATALSGNLSDIGIPAIVQLATTTGLTGRIVISAEKRVVGMLGVGGGEVHHCTYQDETGDEAFLRLALLRDGSFEFRPGDPPLERNIEGSPMTLIMEALRRQDEALRAS